MFITEQNTANWSQMIKENLHVEDQAKLNWMSEYAARHEIYEASLGINGTPQGGQVVVPGQGVSPIYATPLNTTGMGNPTAPSPLSTTSTTPGEFFGQVPGSGDIPVSTLPMSLNIALTTVGFELLPVIPAKGPWTLVNFMDFPYAGGKTGGKGQIAGIDGIGEGRENKPLYFKVVLDGDLIAIIRNEVKAGDKIAFKAGDAVVNGYYKQIGRMDGGLIAEVIDVTDKDEEGVVYNTSLKAVFAKGIDTIEINGAAIDLDPEKLALAKVDFAQTQVDFVDGFANFATGKKEAMTRAQNETGTGNVIGLRLFSKWVQCGSYEVTGTVTRQQLQDLPLYGVDAISTVMEAMQNEISQSINARILEYVRALGVTNAVNQRNIQGVDLNLHMGTADTTMAALPIPEYTDVNGIDHKGTWGAIKNIEVNTSAENLHTRQRRIASRILAAANLIAITGRRGRATWVVTNAQVATALQDNSSYVVNPMLNTLSQGATQSLYLAGTLAGLQVFVDPYQTWEDTRVTVGRKGNGKEPGLVFMPYLLADTVSITSEGTMAPKMLVNSRYALVPIGFYPETQYYTFVVDSDFGII